MQMLYKMRFDAGRQGRLDGVFVADSEVMDVLVGSEIQIYFGEVLGKHSEVCGNLTASEVRAVTSNPNVLEMFRSHDLCSGYNPLNYPVLRESVPEGIAHYDDMTVGELVAEILKRRKG